MPDHASVVKGENCPLILKKEGGSPFFFEFNKFFSLFPGLKTNNLLFISC